MIKKLHAPDYGLLIALGILIIFGLVMLASASSVLGYEKFGDTFFYLKRQVLFGLLPGLVALIVLARVRYQIWLKISPWFLLVSLGLLAAVFVPGLGLKLGGSRSWLSVAGFAFQPAEIIKLTFLIYLAGWLDSRLEVIKNFRQTVLPLAGLLALVVGLVVLQPDIGTVSIIIVMVLVVFFAAGASITHILGLVVAGAAGLLALIQLAPYRISRLTIYLNPASDTQGIGYHINQALLAVGSGGLFGLGFGHSRQKFAYLPEAAGDSIFAVAAEELGFLLSIAVIALFCFLVYRILMIGKYAPDNFGRLLAVGIGAWIGVQSLLNIGAMVGVFPLTGLPLPFVSHGGTALLSLMAALGILINISRQTGQIVTRPKVRIRKRQ